MEGLEAVVLKPRVEPSVLMVKRTVLRRMCWLEGFMVDRRIAVIGHGRE